MNIETILTGLIFWLVGLVSCTFIYCHWECNYWRISEILKVMGGGLCASITDFPAYIVHYRRCAHCA